MLHDEPEKGKGNRIAEEMKGKRQKQEAACLLCFCLDALPLP